MSDFGILERVSPLRLEETLREKSSLPIILGKSISEIGAVDHINLSKIKENGSEQARSKVEALEDFANAVHLIFNPKQFSKAKSIPINFIVSNLQKFEEWVENHGNTLYQYPFQKQFFYKAISESLKSRTPIDVAALNMLPVLCPVEIKKFCQYRENFDLIQNHRFFKTIWENVNSKEIVNNFYQEVKGEVKLKKPINEEVKKDNVVSLSEVDDLATGILEGARWTVAQQEDGNEAFTLRGTFSKENLDMLQKIREEAEQKNALAKGTGGNKNIERFSNSIKELSQEIDKERENQHSIVGKTFSEHLNDKFGARFLELLYGIREDQKEREIKIGDFISALTNLDDSVVYNLSTIFPLNKLDEQSAIRINASDVDGTEMWNGFKHLSEKDSSIKDIICDLIEKSIIVSPEMRSSERERLFCAIVNANSLITKDEAKLKFRREIFEKVGVNLSKFSLIGEVQEQKMKSGNRVISRFILLPAKREDNGFVAGQNAKEYTEATFYKEINHPLQAIPIKAREEFEKRKLSNIQVEQSAREVLSN